jgi:hypothetical protein
MELTIGRQLVSVKVAEQHKTYGQEAQIYGIQNDE